jgi:hypothetical protein
MEKLRKFLINTVQMYSNDFKWLKVFFAELFCARNGQNSLTMTISVSCCVDNS